MENSRGYMLEDLAPSRIWPTWDRVATVGIRASGKGFLSVASCIRILFGHNISLDLNEQ